MTSSASLRGERSAVPSMDRTRPAPRFRLGTRGSALAVMQSSTIADALRALGAEVELVTVRTLGDDRPPDTTWGEGAFVGALESALLDGSVDIAVHSAKDVPTTVPDALTIAAYPGREDPRDALVGRDPGLTLDSLPPGSRLGTDSPRRSAFLRALRPDLRLHPLHGNVDTRLRRLDEGETDALVLAVAGLTRLGRADRIGSILPADAVPPAPGQGSLAVECRTDDAVAVEWLSRLDDPATRAAVEAERAFLRACGGGCRAPIGAIARVEDGEIVLQAATAGVEAPDVAPGGRPLIAHGMRHGPVGDRLAIAADLASQLTRELAGHAAGAGHDVPRASRHVLITRPQGTRALADTLAARGLRVIAVPTIAIEPAEPASLDAAVAGFPRGGWIALTSGNAVRPVVEAIARAGRAPDDFRWAAVGSATADALGALGIAASFTPSRADGASLATELPLDPAPVLLPRSEIADPATPATLRARGAVVGEVVAYRTVEGPPESRDAARAAFGSDGPAAIVFTSGSTVRGLLALLGPAHAARARSTPACCIGEATAAVARELGFTRVVVASAPTPESIADAVASAAPLGAVASPAPADAASSAPHPEAAPPGRRKDRP